MRRLGGFGMPHPIPSHPIPAAVPNVPGDCRTGRAIPETFTAARPVDRTPVTPEAKQDLDAKHEPQAGGAARVATFKLIDLDGDITLPGALGVRRCGSPLGATTGEAPLSAAARRARPLRLPCLAARPPSTPAMRGRPTPPSTGRATSRRGATDSRSTWSPGAGRTPGRPPGAPPTPPRLSSYGLLASGTAWTSPTVAAHPGRVAGLRSIGRRRSASTSPPQPIGWKPRTW